MSQQWKPIHTEFPDIRNFGWQDGYGAFTVNKSIVPDIEHYIQISANTITR